MIEDGWEAHVRKAIFRIADTDFDGGLAMLQEYIDAHPSSPSGYFYYAAGLQEKMQKHNDLTQIKKFRKYADKCQSLCRARLYRDQEDTVARIFLGATDGYIGLLDAKQRHLLRAFKNGVEAKSNLEQALLENPDIPDTRFGLGMLYYFSSRKSAEEGGMIAWIIRNFITHGKDMRAEAMEMLRLVVKSDALSRDYALSALMWIYLYEHKYNAAENIAYQVANIYQNDTISRWVLGRVALKEKRCSDAIFWFGLVKQINADLGLAAEDFEDVDIAVKKAEICQRLKSLDIDKARELNNQVGKWLYSNPKISLEYQDEKNLIRSWKKEHKAMKKKLRVYRKRPLNGD